MWAGKGPSGPYFFHHGTIISDLRMSQSQTRHSLTQTAEHPGAAAGALGAQGSRTGRRPTHGVVWQSRLGSLRVSWHLPWFPYLLPLSGGWSNSSGDESAPGLILGCSSWHCVPSPCQLGCSSGSLALPLHTVAKEPSLWQAAPTCPPVPGLRRASWQNLTMVSLTLHHCPASQVPSASQGPTQLPGYLVNAKVDSERKS